MNATSDPQAIAEPTAVAIFPAQHQRTPVLSHRAARQGLVGKTHRGRVEAEAEAEMQANLGYRGSRKGWGGIGRFVRSMSWLWPRASMDDSHAAITDLEAIPTCHHKHRNQATTHVNRLDGWGG